MLKLHYCCFIHFFFDNTDISSVGLPGIGYTKQQQQQNTSITLPPPSRVHQQSDIGVTDSRDIGIKIESGAISVPVLGKDLVLTEKDLINIANTISSTNRDTLHEVAPQPLPNAQQPLPPQLPVNNLPPFEPRRNFNQGPSDVPWETNYPPRPPPPPPHGDWNQPPIGPPGREEFNRPPPKEWGEFPPPEFRRFHGRPNEWVHPSRRPEGGWGFDQQRDRRWKGDMPGPHEFHRDFRGDRDHGGMRDFPPEQFDDRRIQDGGERMFHRYDDHNRPNDGAKFPTRDPYRWERGDQPQPNWGGQEQFDARTSNSGQPQKPPFPDQQQQQPGCEEDSGRQQQTALENKQGLNQQGFDPSKGPMNVPTDVAKGPIPQQQYGGQGGQDQLHTAAPLNQPLQFDAGRAINDQGQRPPSQPIRRPDGSFQGVPPGHHMPGQQGSGGPPSRGLPNQQVRDPRMEGLQGGPPKQPNFPDEHKQQVPMGRPPAPDRPFDRGDGPPPQVMPSGPGGPSSQPQQPPRGPRNREAAWLQDANQFNASRAGPRSNVPPGQQQHFDATRSQDNSFPANVTFPPSNVPPPNVPFDPTKPPPFMPNQPPPPFRNQEQMPPLLEGLSRPQMHAIPHQEPSLRGHPPEGLGMDVPKRQEQFVQKSLKQHDSTAPPWSAAAAATKPIEQPMGGLFNDQPTNQQIQNLLNARTLLPTPPQDGGSKPSDNVPTSVPTEGFHKPPFSDKGPGQMIDPRIQNARQDNMSFDPRMGQNINQRGDVRQQQQQPPQGDMNMIMPPDRRTRDFRMEGGRPDMRPMGQNFDPRMRPGREEGGHPPQQEFQLSRERDMIQEPPWSSGGMDRGQPHDFQEDKRRTLLPPPIMLHNDEDTNSHPPGRQGEFPDDGRRRDQRFDDYRGEKSWHGRPDYDRGRRDPQREPRRSPPRRNSASDRPPTKRPRRDKEPSNRHVGERDRERNNDKEKDRKPERSRGNDKPKSNDRSTEKTVGSEKPRNS